jgi:hypothetical protein
LDFFLPPLPPLATVFLAGFLEEGVLAMVKVGVYSKVTSYARETGVLSSRKKMGKFGLERDWPGQR